MKLFLLVYDRARGKLVDEPMTFVESRRADALRARFQREIIERSHPEIEVVLLGAESIDDLKRTHARYFNSLEELAASA